MDATTTLTDTVTLGVEIFSRLLRRLVDTASPNELPDVLVVALGGLAITFALILYVGHDLPR